jgi:xanthine dehydrogenase small subunit
MGHTASTIRFLLNGAPHNVQGVHPQTTLLQYLREHMQMVGTKEGCAEGDCGACTVAIGELSADGRVAINPVNACIRLLPTLDGKAVFTVEALAATQRLHPVQQAMVSCHASQCGFCTPGFVMTLFALFKNEASPSRQQVCEAISGNLCRCTGYRPIIDAGAAMYPLAADAQEDSQNNISPLQRWMRTPAAALASTPDDEALAQSLRALQRTETLDYVAAGARFIAPRTVAQFSACVLNNPEAWILGGGTDIGLWINKALQSNALIVYTGEVAALRNIAEDDHTMTIGAAVSLDAAFHAMNRLYPELAHVWTRFASWPIRTSGTLGGNVANGSPIGDSMPALIALGANVLLRKGDAQRVLPIESLYVDYKKQARDKGEWVEAIVLPKRRRAMQVAFYKNSKRNEQDISAVCTAIAISVDGGTVTQCRIGYGGMAGVPKRALRTEHALIGKPWNEAQVRAAMQAVTDDFTPMSDMRASAGYRLQIAQNHLLRFWYESQGSHAETQTRVF